MVGKALASWLPPRVRQVLGMDRGRLLLVVEGECVAPASAAWR
jgi:hypothetical protein